MQIPREPHLPVLVETSGMGHFCRTDPPHFEGFHGFAGGGPERVTLKWDRLSVALPKKKSSGTEPIFQDLQGSANPGRWGPTMP